MKLFVSKTLKSLIFLGVLALAAGLVCGDAFAGATYDYYASGRVKNVTYSPAVSGVTFEEYLDEDWLGQGFGRVQKKVLSAADSDGAISYVYAYPKETMLLSAKLGGAVGDDIVAAVGSDGLWEYMDNSSWLQISSGTPETMAKAKLNANSVDDLIVDFGAAGLWKYADNGSWSGLSSSNADNIAVGDLDNSGIDDIVVDFGSTGLWSYSNDSTWALISASNAKDIAVGDLDNNGQADVIVDFGNLGLYKYMNGSTWSKVSNSTTEKVIIADMDNNGTKDMVVDFGSLGLYKYMNNVSWEKISNTNAENVLVADFDNNGTNDMIVDFGSAGLYRYMNNSSWTKLSDTNPEKILTADLDNNGVKDVVADFGSSGLYEYMNGSSWIKISSTNATDVTVADLDGNGSDDLVVDFGAAGLYKYTANADWAYISSLNASRTTTKNGYLTTDFAGLIFTETYNASGALTGKTYTNTIENYAETPFLMKRKTEAATGDIYEYLNENWNSQGWGRIITHFDSSENAYRTYSWDASQVTVTQYSGAYAPTGGSAVQSDVAVGEKRSVYIYDHKNQEVNLTYPANGWVMRAQTQYDTDGATVLNRYGYDATGRLTMEEDTVNQKTFTYTYHTGDYSTVKQYKYEYGMTDSALTAAGNAQKDTAYAKFGTASALFDGSGDYLIAPASSIFNLTGDFTVDLWVRFNSLGANNGLFGAYGGGSTGYQLYCSSSALKLYNDGAEQTLAWTPGTGAWYHVALVRSGTVITAYINGSSIGTFSNTVLDNHNLPFEIGAAGGGSLAMNGNIDEFRISNAARWTGAFTPPTSASSGDANTVFLAHNDGADGATDFTTTENRLIRTFEYNTSGELVRVIYAQPGQEFYTADPWKLKREITAGSDIYERLNEAYGGNDYGRITLLYDSSDVAYRTYDWGASQVTVNSYSGVYLIENGDDVRHGIVASDRNDTFIYDHKTHQTDLDTLTNGWVMREHTIYGADGVTMAEKYVYNSSGHLTRDDHVASGKYYTYTYFTADANRIKYKEERNLSDNSLIATYTYFYSGGNHYTSGQLNADGSYVKYYYNDLWEFTGAEWQSADRLTVRKYDSGWNMMTEKTFTGTPFMRGINLPWLEYGYDAGTDTLGSVPYKGYGSNELRLWQGNSATKYRGLETWRGDFVRIFIFGDMRSGVTFSGTTPTGIQATAYTDMQALCDAAELLGIKLIPVLLDFKMADGISTEGSTNVGDHPTCITNTTDRNALVSVLGDFVDYFKNESSIYAWEIMNEPEEIKYDNQATWEELQTFVKAMAAEIHAEDPGSIVTLGAQDRRTLFGVDGDPTQPARWTDATLGGTAAEHLDLYQFHYYNNMEGYDPTRLDVDCPDAGKPVLMGEVDPSQDANNGMSIVSRLNNVYFNGYDGALFWEDDQAKYPTFSDASYNDIQNWTYGLVVDEHYEPSGFLKRKTEETGNVYEYMNENWESQGWGRTILSCDNGSGYYYTFAWENPLAGQVKVEKYQGSYGPASGSATWSDVQSGERRETTVYVHNGQEINLNVSTNGWLIQEQIVYPSDRKYTFEYYSAPNQTKVHYKREYINSTSELYATYTYDTSGTLISVVYQGNAVENYLSGKLKRQIDADGDVYEYRDEDWGGTGQGRMVLSYDHTLGKYWTYDWGSSGATQVTVIGYSGAYVPPAGSDPWSDVTAGEKRQTCIYDHNGEQTDLNTSTNGWVLRQKTDYGTDGTTMTGQYSYYASGRLTRQIAGNLDTTERLDEAANRISLYYDSASTEYKTYDWGATQVTMTVYDGTYLVGINSAARADRQDSERRWIYVYDHKNEFEDLNTVTNGWVMRLKTTYAANGTTITERESYYDNGNKKRYQPGSSNVDTTEYSETSAGRTTLYASYSGSNYKTYDWGSTQVTVKEYSGQYWADINADPRADVQGGEKRIEYAFDHNGEQVDLNTGTNGWVMRLKTEYAANGSTVNTRYSFYSNGYDKRKISSSGADNGDITEYLQATDGRITLFYDASDGKYKTYTWGATQVTIAEYAGTYSVGIDDAAGLDVVPSEQRTMYVYDHNSQYSNLDPGTNGWKMRKKEEYNTSASWLRTYWYYTSGNGSKKIESTGEAATYFDVAGWKTQTYWGTNGTISGWDATANYDAGKSSWYKSGGTLEVYQYYTSWNPKYKDVYVDSNSDGTWEWQSAVAMKDEPGWVWDHDATRAETGASATRTIPTKPTRTDVSSLDLNVDILTAEDDTLIPESMQLFYSKVDELKANSTGEGVLVAMLDSGASLTIPHRNDSRCGIVGGVDFTGAGDPYLDVVGHGTKMAEALLATASEADILALKVMDENKETTSERVSEAIRYAVDSGAKVINMSFTLFPVSDDLKSALDYAASKNVVLVAAAGNEGTEILDAALAAQDNVITVGFVDRDGKLSAWSNYGEEVDLYAPWDVMEQRSADSGQRTGTSYSAAFVAGIAALILENNPDFTADDVLTQLKAMMPAVKKDAEVKAEVKVEVKVENEVLSLQNALAKQNAEFTGVGVKDDSLTTVTE